LLHSNLLYRISISRRIGLYVIALGLARATTCATGPHKKIDHISVSSVSVFYSVFSRFMWSRHSPANARERRRVRPVVASLPDRLERQTHSGMHGSAPPTFSPAHYRLQTPP